MTTKTEYAQLSAYVYDVKNLDGNRPLVPIGWEQLIYQPDGFDGFSYGVFRRIGTDEVVVAYTGTNQAVLDWIANITNGVGLPLTQLINAAAAYSQAKRAYGDKITVTGHSLGGGLASTVAVWFDRPAVVFDQAPFEFSARNPLLLVPAKVGLALAGYSDPAFTSYSGTLDFAAREAKVSNYYTSGEALAVLRAYWPTVGGPIDQAVPFGSANMTGLLDPINLHSMALLAAGLLSDPFRLATIKVQRALPLLFDTGFYAYDTRTSNQQNLLVNFIRSEQGTGKKLTHFAADLQKIGTNLAGLMPKPPSPHPTESCSKPATTSSPTWRATSSRTAASTFLCAPCSAYSRPTRAATHSSSVPTM
jgi:hypothetical protein